MTDDIGIDIDLAQTRVRQLLDGCDAVRGYEFVYADVALPGLAATAVFDRAVHSLAWTTVQVVTGASTELVNSGAAIVATVGDFDEFDADIADRLATVQRELEFAAS